jgi:hypothetical protein
MRHLKDYQGDGGTDRLLQDLGLPKGDAQDHQQAAALFDALPENTIRETFRLIGLDIHEDEAETPAAKYREAWLAIQAASFRQVETCAHQ